MINTPLNDWNTADFQRSGFDADGKSSPELRQAAGKPQLTPSPDSHVYTQVFRFTILGVWVGVWERVKIDEICGSGHPAANNRALFAAGWPLPQLMYNDKRRAWPIGWQQAAVRWCFANTSADDINGICAQKGELVGFSVASITHWINHR